MKTGGVLLFVVIVVLLIVGAYLLMNSSYSISSGNPETSSDTLDTSDSNPSESTGSTGQSSAPSSAFVTISDFAFSPATLTVKVGDSVIWTNMDSAIHTVTSDSENELNSALLSKEQTYSKTFTTAGTYKYHCTPHPYMKGTVIVQ